MHTYIHSRCDSTSSLISSSIAHLLRSTGVNAAQVRKGGSAGERLTWAMHRVILLKRLKNCFMRYETTPRSLFLHIYVYVCVYVYINMCVGMIIKYMDIYLDM